VRTALKRGAFDVILGCAAGGGVQYLVTGDADLLALKRCETVVILTAREFLAVLRR